jgi:phosphopantothenoylcysteine synthetase/decarboxylase
MLTTSHSKIDRRLTRIVAQRAASCPQPACQDRRVPILYLVATGARPAADLPDIAAQLIERGWTCCATLTPDALKFTDAARLAKLTGFPVRSVYKQPHEPDVHPPADAYLAAPVTFNSLNRWADGHSDTLALGLLNEALGMGKPIVAVPWINTALAAHPAVPGNLERLTAAGVIFILDHGLLPEPRSAEAGADTFPWETALASLPQLPGAATNP